MREALCIMMGGRVLAASCGVVEGTARPGVTWRCAARACVLRCAQVGVVTSSCQDAAGEWVGLGYIRSRVGGTQINLEGE